MLNWGLDKKRNDKTYKTQESRKLRDSCLQVTFMIKSSVNLSLYIYLYLVSQGKNLTSAEEGHLPETTPKPASS